MNLVRLGLDPRGFAPLVVNLDDVRAMFRSRIRRQLAIAPDTELTALYEELLEVNTEETSKQSVESDVVIPMILRFDGRELRLFSTITTFGTPMEITLDEVAIESYYPADAESASYFEESNSDVRPTSYPAPAERPARASIGTAVEARAVRRCAGRGSDGLRAPCTPVPARRGPHGAGVRPARHRQSAQQLVHACAHVHAPISRAQSSPPLPRPRLPPALRRPHMNHPAEHRAPHTNRPIPPFYLFRNGP